TQWATLDADCAAGIHVLVSPLDQRSADIRFFDSDGLQIDKRAERKLENLLFREDFRRAGFYEMGDIEYGEPIAGYTAHLFKSVDGDVIRNALFRVLIDYDYSDASAVLPAILNELGVTTIPLNAGMREGGHHRTVPDETALISKTVRADVGCMISPTGERITIIDEKGVVLTPHECLAILATWWVRSNPGTVLAPAATPMWIGDLVRKEGGTLSATPGDPASVLRASALAGTSIASDGEGGFAWPGHLGAFDAMYTLVKLLELRAKIGIPLSRAREALPQVAYVTATEFCPWEAKGRVMRILLDRHRTDSVDLVDGIKVYVDDGFVLVRPDPDEPAYHVVASVTDPERGRQLVDEYLAQVREAEGANGVRAPVEAAAGAE
ncbi:MAG TPA: hypothetical protein VG299_02690, partial [Candidatus Dormibacteraeota bacterium]|nr:hypothetical protein [Candidatus Dormibacteraeota bacterium]